MKISKRQREERYLYYRAAAGEISVKIRETVSSDLYNEIQCFLKGWCKDENHKTGGFTMSLCRCF